MTHSLAMNDYGIQPSASNDLLVAAERICIGYHLTPSNALHAQETVAELEPRHFLLPAHEVIYDAVQRAAGNPDSYMRVLDMLTGRNVPRALDALDRPLAIYLTDCIHAADYFDTATMRSHAARVREAWTRRHGQELLTQVAHAFMNGNVDAAYMGWQTFGQMLEPSTQLAIGPHRNVNLMPYLDGTHQPLMPGVGALRDDNVPMLYAGLWHTVIAPNTAGKSWFALWHCIEEMRRGNTVVYAHFEESSPNGTLGRIRQIAPDLTVEQINELFRWLDCSVRWAPGEFVKALPAAPTLVVLDGVNACCGTHGWVVDKPEAVGAYRATFVTPAARLGAAVLSLGHPVKNIERQNERHGYGATGWLDEVNGVAFRLVPSKKTPIGKGQLGHSTLYTVKDREGEVQVRGLLDTGDKREGWYRLGSFKVDDGPETRNTSAWLNVPVADEELAGEAVMERPIPAMVACSKLLADNSVGLSKNAVEQLVGGKAATVRAALELLVSDGYVRVEQVGQAKKHFLVKPFHDQHVADEALS